MRTLLLAVATALASTSVAAPPPDGLVRRFGDDRWRFTGEFGNSALAPDGKRLAVLSLSQPRSTAVVTLVDVATGRPLVAGRVALFGPHLFARPGLAFSPTGNHLAVVLSSETIAVIATDTGREVWRAEDVRTPFSFCAFDPAGRLILTRQDETHVYDIPSGKVAATWPVGGLAKVTPDAKTYVRVVQEDRDIAIGDTATGKPRHVLPLRTAHNGSENGFALAHDGRTLAVVHANAEVHLVDLATGQTRRKWELVAHTLPPLNAEYAIAFSADDRTLSLSTTAQILSWDLDPFRERKTLPQGQSEAVRGWHFLPAGGPLLIPRRNVVERWTAATGGRVPEAFPAGGEAFAPTPDGTQLVVGDGLGRVGVWDTATGAFVRPLAAAPPTGQGVRAVAVSPTGRHVAIGRQDSDFEVLPLDANANPANAAASVATSGSMFLAWSPDGRFVYGTRAGKNGPRTLVQFDAQQNRVVKAINVEEPITLTPDGRELLYRSQEFSTEVGRYEIATDGKRGNFDRDDHRIGSNRYVGRLSPGGAVLALGADHEIELLGTRLPPIVATDYYTVGGEFGRQKSAPPVRTLAFTPNGLWLISGGDCAVKVWEVATRRLVRRFDGHDLPVTHVAASPDGRSVFSGSRDGFVNQWALVPADAALPATPEALWAAVLAVDPAAGLPAAWRLMGDEKLRAFALRKLPPVSKPDAAKVATRIADLDAPAYADRQAATRDLQGFSRTVEAELREALQKTPSAEVRQRLEGLIARFDKKYSPEEFGAMRLVQAGEWHRLREPLTAWAAGAPSAVLTREAKAALARLK